MTMTTDNFSRGMESLFRGSCAGLALAFSLLLSMNTNADTEAVFTPFAPLLADHVDNGNVDYRAFARSTEFAQMVTALATLAPAQDADQANRLAFYINAYNALSIQGILDGYSPESIWGRLKFFKRRKYDAFNTSLSLYELEHERIISEGEPRIHFAIVCASQSCPPLQSTLFTPAGLDAQLDAAARGFINAQDKNQFDVANRKATLSRIFKWYKQEFEVAGGGSLAGYLAQYADDPALAQSLKNDDWSFSYFPYDWSLNGISPKE
ncbi:MAG: DUF547 domain-containing protein [Pseudomonadota bacterium]